MSQDPQTASGDQLALPASPRNKPRIQARTLHDVTRYLAADESTLSARIRELETEWDVERTFEANAAAISLLGIAPA
jgi:hypothetical protein